MFGVYKISPMGKKREYIRIFEHEIDALDYCDFHGWEYCDPETRFVWKLDYKEV